MSSEFKHKNARDKISRDKIPRDKIPRDKIPKDKIPKDKIPKDKIPRDKIPKDKIPKDKIPKDKIPKDKIPKDKIPRDKIPRDKKIEFIYTYNNNFTLIIRNNNLFIIINNNNKTPYISKWKLKNDNNIIGIESNDNYNKVLTLEHINILTNNILTNIPKNNINILGKMYTYYNRSIIDLTIKIINTTYMSKEKIRTDNNKLQIGGNINILDLIKNNILNKISSTDNLSILDIKDYIELDYLKYL